MKIRNFGQVILIMSMMGFAVSAMADEVFLKNGDRLSGTVVAKTDDKLVFKTKYAGEIKIDWAEVSRLTTDQPVRLQLSDEKIIDGTLAASEDNKLNIATDETTPKEIPLSEVAAINPPDNNGLKFSGHLNVGLTRESGNTDENRYHLDGETTLRWPDDRLIFSFNGDYVDTDSVKTKESLNLYGTHDHFLGEQWYWNNGLSFEHDRFADLRLRTTATTGLGYQVFESERTNLSVQAGPGYVWENFYEGENQNFAAGIWSLRFDRVLVPDWKLKAFHNHRLSMSLESTSDYIFISQTGVRIPLFDSFQTTLQFNFDRDNTPGLDAKKNDYKYLITVGYVW